MKLDRFRKRLENVHRTNSNPLARNWRISKEGAICSKETRTFRKKLEKIRKVTRESQKKERTARKRLEHLRKQGANRRKGTTEFHKKGQTARKRVAKETREFGDKEQAARKEPGSVRARSKPLERD